MHPSFHPHRWRVACHEAAHSLAALYQGVDVERVDVADDGQDGGVTLAAVPQDERKAMFMLAAGEAGERLLVGPSGYEHRTHSQDRESALQYATHYSKDDHLAGLRMLAFVRGEADEFCRQCANQIAHVAQHLYARGVLSGDDLRALVGGA